MILEKKLEKALKKKNITEIDYVFEEIYNQYYNLIVYIVSQKIKNNNDVEELVNDIFVNFYTNCIKKKIDNIKYYLVKSSQNICIDYMRKNKICYEYNEEYINNYNENNEIVLYDEVMELLEKYLSKDEIQIILLHHLDGYSLKEISNRLNKPYSTIVSKYDRAIKKFKKEVNKDEN